MQGQARRVQLTKVKGKHKKDLACAKSLTAEKNCSTEPFIVPSMGNHGGLLKVSRTVLDLNLLGYDKKIYKSKPYTRY